MRSHSLVRLLGHVVAKYQRDDCNSLAAALAYFALFSFFPLILVSLSVVGFFVDPSRYEVQRQIINLIGAPELRELVTETLANLSENRVNVGLIGFGTLLLAATGVFGALDNAFHVIWEIDPAEGGGLGAAVRSLLTARLLAFALVLGCAVLIMAAALANALLSLAARFTDWLPQGDLLLQLAQLATTLLLIAVAMGAIFKVMPGRRAAWRDVWPAAIVAALLFAALQGVAGLVFSRISFSSYGAVGGAMTLLLWIFLCCQIILIGGELSYAWARTYGSLRGVEH
jgi:membrane protein